MPFFDTDPVVARVRMKYLRQSDIDKQLGKDAGPQQQQDYIEHWINKRLWYIEAKKSASLNAEARQLIKEYRSTLLIRQYQEDQFLNNIMITENEVIDYYEKNKARYIAKQDAAFIEIFVCDNKDAAYDIVEKLKNTEKPTYPSRLQLVNRGSCVDALDKKIFSSKPATIIGPIANNSEYFVVSLIDRYPQNSQLKVEHVREDIIQKLRIMKYNSIIQQKEKELKEKINVKIFKNNSN